jgi:hypothetical protein
MSFRAATALTSPTIIFLAGERSGAAAKGCSTGTLGQSKGYSKRYSRVLKRRGTLEIHRTAIEFCFFAAACAAPPGRRGSPASPAIPAATAGGGSPAPPERPERTVRLRVSVCVCLCVCVCYHKATAARYCKGRCTEYSGCPSVLSGGTRRGTHRVLPGHLQGYPQGTHRGTPGSHRALAGALPPTGPSKPLQARPARPVRRESPATTASPPPSPAHRAATCAASYMLTPPACRRAS